ncbi:PPOX class F420-dependent oxidoreductase [Yinghuangia seranimata]|uniref:PPOX class F420-dependent oxidoreductase n=1 Tax=Yinghuangia seranimata TaxID=408067 RepID=UPI00248C7C4C|nr:PPOX class F420-dependent oxidoreductase [Yinghuangia seranimata]MDI2124528.1 PPOX class F420-dependent oxidoreductase [Yinghuangia seranimata]
MTTLHDDVRALFAGVNFAHLATLMPDGSPHSVPLWVDMEGDRVAFLTGPTSRKARNLDKDPRVALSVLDAADPRRMAHARGRVVKCVDGDEGWAIIDRMALKYLGVPYPRGEERVVYLVEVEHSGFMSF